jgi:hypothetical protein
MNIFKRKKETPKFDKQKWERRADALISERVKAQDQQRESILHELQSNPDKRELTHEFHGACLDCTTPEMHGVGMCTLCQYARLGGTRDMCSGSYRP